MTEELSFSAPLRKYKENYLKHNESEWEELEKPTLFFKLRSSNKWYNRIFWLDMNEMCICYDKSQKMFRKAQNIKLENLNQVLHGWKTDVFKEAVQNRSISNENVCFSLIYGNDNKTLDLVAHNEKVAQTWVSGLCSLITIFQDLRRKEIDDGFESISEEISASSSSFTKINASMVSNRDPTSHSQIIQKDDGITAIKVETEQQNVKDLQDIPAPKTNLYPDLGVTQWIDTVDTSSDPLVDLDFSLNMTETPQNLKRPSQQGHTATTNIIIAKLDPFVTADKDTNYPQASSLVKELEILNEPIKNSSTHQLAQAERVDTMEVPNNWAENFIPAPANSVSPTKTTPNEKIQLKEMLPKYNKIPEENSVKFNSFNGNGKDN